ASSTDPSTWGTFDTAIASSRKYGNGIGFVFTADDHFAGVDLDHCIDSQTGDVKAWARVILNDFDSYCEASPSGTGVKIFLRAAKTGSRCKTGYEDGAIEMYDSGRFFTVTGARWGGYSTDVEERQEQFDALYAKVLGKPEKKPPASSETTPPATSTLTDDEIIQLACSSRKSGTKFSALWNGRWEEYFNSASEADSSVIFTLAFYTKDSSQLDRLFRCSELMRPKWDERHGEETYGNLTISNALQHVTKQYRPRNAIANAKRSSPQPPADTGRPQIQHNERQLRDVRDDALQAVIAANVPPRLFSRGEGIARIALVRHDGATEAPMIQQLESNALRGELTNVADWFALKHLKQVDKLEADLPPLAVARDILALPQVGLPPLNAIITCPAFTPSGNLIIKSGYDAESGLWHHRSLSKIAGVPLRPTPREIGSAREVLINIIAEFPFIDQASLANALALLLLPFVRPMIEGPTPLFAADAPTAGTGKGLLVQVCLWPALGYSLDIRTGARDQDEWRKRITSELVAGRPAIGFDNATSRLDSEHLAAVLTATLWTDRILATSKVVTVPNRAVWVCTGNNLAFSKELARRVIWIRLDARIEAPEQRTGFQHPDLVGFVRERRAALVHAAITLLRAWLDSGRPRGTQVMGSYENFAAVMGGILDVAGVSGFLANADQLRQQADSESAEWRAFVHAWWDRWKDTWVGVSDLFQLIWGEDGRRTDLLMGVVKSDRERGAATQLGMRLSKKRECVISGLRIVVNQGGDNSGRLQYHLVPVENGDDPHTSYRPFNEVCTKVCDDKSAAGNELEAECIPCIPFLPSSGPYAGAHPRAHAPARETDGEPPKRSARSATSAQVDDSVTVTTADLDADLVQALQPPIGRSATLARGNDVGWFNGNADDIPKEVIELASKRDGWTASSWRDRMLRLADTCASNNPERAAEFRQAAALMSSDEGRAP
ncbi:MAG: hypothetical protein KDA54_22410, partial [Phycisphaerales bacterium]|nr:hypothetical protein [Phycisphaerales bacterium]